MPTIRETIEFIKQAHAGQKDKGGEDYYHHPIAVMYSLPEGMKPVSQEVKLAALLHDVIDDTRDKPVCYTRRDLEAMGYTKTTLDIVDLLSKYRPDGTLDGRSYAEKIDHIIDSHNEGAILVKYADMCQNTLPERLENSGARIRLEKKYAEPMRKLTEAVYILGYIKEPTLPNPLPAPAKTKSKDDVLVRRQRAQEALVDATIRASLRHLYMQAEQNRNPVNTEITLHSHIVTGNRYHDDHREVTIPLCNAKGEHCASAEEAWESIHDLFETEFDRVDAFNALAQVNGFDITLRTSGLKSETSIHEKAKRRYRGDVGKIKDIARLMVISRDPRTLEAIGRNLENSVKIEGSSPNATLLEDWEMMRGGVLKQTLVTQLAGIPAEVQFVPFEQETIAGKIVHKLYKIMRSWDVAQDNPDDASRTAQIKDIAVRYNRAAAFINGLYESSGASAKSDDGTAWKQANRALAEIDEPVNESQPNGQQPHASSEKRLTIVPVFKDAKDLESFREYLRGGSRLLSATRKKTILPLPIISLRSEPGKVDLEKGISRLENVRQITLTYYMQQATEEMRTLWRDKAYELNAKQPDAMPEDFIKSVCRGRDGATPIEYQDANDRQKGRKI